MQENISLYKYWLKDVVLRKATDPRTVEVGIGRGIQKVFPESRNICVYVDVFTFELENPANSWELRQMGKALCKHLPDLAIHKKTYFSLPNEKGTPAIMLKENWKWGVSRQLFVRSRRILR